MSGQSPERKAGKTVVIGVIDDHTRLAYCELYCAESAANVSITIRRAARWFSEQGCRPVQAVMSDNAKCYSASFAFRGALAELGARHILIPPYTPRWNGKIERFFGTLDCEWAHGRVWANSTERDRALASFIRFYNRKRPHSAAGVGRPSAAFTKSVGRTASTLHRPLRSSRLRRADARSATTGAGAAPKGDSRGRFALLASPDVQPS